MTGFLRLILFFLIFLIIIRLVRVIKRIWFSSKETINFVKNQKKPDTEKFRDVEEADFTEIPTEKKNERSEKIN